MRSLALFLSGISGVLALTIAPACNDEPDCFALGIIDEVAYDGTLPADVDVLTLTIEVCFGATCDQARLVDGPQGLHCEDIDTRTPSFPTTCTVDADRKTIRFKTNTVYGGHAGQDELRVDAKDSAGVASAVVRGRVTYENRTDDVARSACTERWHGTFTKT